MTKLKTVIFSLTLAYFLSGCSYSGDDVIWEMEQSESQTDRESEEEIGQSDAESEHLICVDICGAVNTPGVYLLEEGARVYQAVELAGGLLTTADRDSVNLAALLKDGEKIRIYTQEEAELLQESEKAAGLVNLNTADVQELCTLTGIGEARAQDIIAYRDANGSFQSVEEIMNVNGIKETTFQKIKDKIVVE